MSGEDVYEAIPVRRVKDCGFIVVTNEKGRSDRKSKPTRDEAEAFARMERGRLGTEGSVKIVELTYMRGAA